DGLPCHLDIDEAPVDRVVASIGMLRGVDVDHLVLLETDPVAQSPLPLVEREAVLGWRWPGRSTHRAYLSRNLRTASLTVSPLSSAFILAASHTRSLTRTTRFFIGSRGMKALYSDAYANA